MSENLSYGKELPDQVPAINATLTHQLVLLTDVRELIKERVALEKEYSIRLSAIAKKAEEKRARHMTHAVLGEECSKAWTDTDVRSSTLDKAFTALINSYENTASDHDSFASALSADVGDALKLLERSKDESRKKQMVFFAKLVAERDRIYGERLKAKQKYDEECDGVETFRQKQASRDRAADDKHADRAAKQLEQQKVEMQNRKNAYLIQIAVANGAKDRFYDDELPLLEDWSNAEMHHADTMRRMTRLLLHSQALHEGHLESVRRSVANTQAALNAVDPLYDQKLYASFIDGLLVNPKTGPSNLVKGYVAMLKGSDLARDVARLTKLVESYGSNPTLGNYDEVWENLLEATHQLTDLELLRVGYQAEMKVIAGALGGDEGAQKPHEFKSTSFSIPAPCGYCKMPAECGIAPELSSSKANSLARASSINSVAPSVSSIAPASSPVGGSPAPPRTNALSRPMPPPATAPPAAAPPQKPRFCTAMQQRANLRFQSLGSIVEIVEHDDGSGWVKILNEQGAEGLVPATYIEVVAPALNKRRAPPPPTRGASVAKLVKALYSYEAQGDDELSLKEGTTYELTPNGENAGDGWWEGIDSKGKKGIFPSNYVCNHSPSLLLLTDGTRLRSNVFDTTYVGFSIDSSFPSV
ncbi:Fes/CIP4, and EFC/F-BAR homology domain [Rhizoctonia solani]|uniref:Fes/CIP4, and EFC/F-BAR homology domain n=1 Tax=Rhizoctonia solani TaxID=456999 RepID=A0A8H7IM98_9AGAM|nr:Fes/CIP4, and EFC/F-BAR homology domain [Rhizoctonia solani]